MTNIDYYDKNHETYINRTLNLDMSKLADEFLNLVGGYGTILDLGCGSGRDSLYFKSKGYDVHAMDGSEAMVKHVKEKLGDKVVWATFEDYETEIIFDGIWACASLLHVPKNQMYKTITKYRDLLKPGGIFFMSFKKAGDDFQHEGRVFTCYDEDSFKELIRAIDGLKIIKVKTTPSVKKDCTCETWISIFLKRVID